MTHLNDFFPGMEELIDRNGLSIQAQENHHVMTAADQRGEQTINRDAKTLGNLVFMKNTSFVLKLV